MKKEEIQQPLEEIQNPQSRSGEEGAPEDGNTGNQNPDTGNGDKDPIVVPPIGPGNPGTPPPPPEKEKE